MLATDAAFEAACRRCGYSFAAASYAASALLMLDVAAAAITRYAAAFIDV